MTLNFIFYVFSWFKNYVKDCHNKMLSADYGSSGNSLLEGDALNLRQLLTIPIQWFVYIYAFLSSYT